MWGEERAMQGDAWSVDTSGLFHGPSAGSRSTAAPGSSSLRIYSPQPIWWPMSLFSVGPKIRRFVKPSGTVLNANRPTTRNFGERAKSHRRSRDGG